MINWGQTDSLVAVDTQTCVAHQVQPKFQWEHPRRRLWALQALEKKEGCVLSVGDPVRVFVAVIARKQFFLQPSSTFLEWSVFPFGSRSQQSSASPYTLGFLGAAGISG